MNVSDLFTTLSLGELSNLCMGEDGAGNIPEKYLPRVIGHANSGLVKIYTRFILSVKSLYIDQQEGRTTYPLLAKYALVAGAGIDLGWEKPFINDLGETFEDDVIKVLNVWDGFGRHLPLNDEGDKDSIFTPKPKVLRVPRAVPGVSLSVEYQAKHVPLTLDKLEQELDLPEILEPALTAYIAWQIYAYMNTQEAQGIASGHQTTFESVCQETVITDAVNTSISTTNIKFHKRGWV